MYVTRLLNYIRAFFSRDRKSGYVGTIPRTPAEMRTWHERPDPKPTYREFVGLPEEKEAE